jgi:hypothetical protein
MTPSTPLEQFLRHAAECESMAKFSHDPGNKAAWHGMAERWMRCAELAKVHGAPQHRSRPKAARKSVETRAH